MQAMAQSTFRTVSGYSTWFAPAGRLFGRLPDTYGYPIDLEPSSDSRRMSA
jgi:hypothetical protein